MENAEMETLRKAAEARCKKVQALVQQRATVKVAWFGFDAEVRSASPFRLDQKADKINLNRDVVVPWFDQLPSQQAEALFTGLTYRAVAALLFSPPEYLWMAAAELHMRSEREQGLDEDYSQAFNAAHRILESHRLDQRLLEHCPEAAAALSEWIRVELEEHPTFDTYPRAAILLSRPDSPENLVQPALDEFVERYGVDEADELTKIINQYVSLEPEDVDRMVELTHKLVFQAFPEAMGLAWDDDEAELNSTDTWPFQARPPAGSGSGWDELERFVANTFARFSGEAGLDYGDALVIGLSVYGISGPHLGAWSCSGAIALQAAGIEFGSNSRQKLLARGWIPYENVPESLHKESPIEHACELADEIVWLLRDLARVASTDDLTLWGRGPAADVAGSFEWQHGGLNVATPQEQRVARPTDHEGLADLVRDALRDATRDEPEEYAPGRFAIESETVKFAVLATEEAFPAIRFHHHVLDVPEELRFQVIEFANALHGRSSTTGVHWWLGNESLWQVGDLLAAKFDEEIFLDHLRTFINIASDRTAEIRARFGEGWEASRDE